MMDNPPLPDAGHFLVGGGGTGVLIRSHDWSSTALGAPRAWPQPMKTIVGVMLAANQPMFVVWGPARVLIYNDAYADVLASKHPGALGRDFLHVWTEIRGDLLPIVEQAYAGQPVHMGDIMLVLLRKGWPEETHFSFSYTPIRDETGAVAGFFCPCVEITEQVLAERRRAADTKRQRQLFEQAPGFIAFLNGPEHVFEFVNASYRHLFGDRSYIGKTVRDALPELEGQDFFELLDRAYDTGERYVAHRVGIRVNREDGTTGELYLDFVYVPVIGESGAIIGIFVEGQDVTDAHRGEIELRANASRQAFRFAVEERLRDLADPIDAISATSETLGQYLDATHVAFAEVEHGDETVLIEREWNNGRMIATTAGVHRLNDYGPALIRDLRRGKTIAIADVRLDPRTSSTGARAAFARTSIVALINVPVVKEGRLVAILGVHSETPREWQAEEISLAAEIANRIWSAAERARARKELRESEARLHASYEEANRTAAELRAVLESMPDAVYIGNSDGITLANQPALDQLGFDTREELNRSIATLADEVQTRDVETGAFIPIEDQAFTRAFRGEHVVMEVLVRNCRSGEDRAVRCAAAPVVIDNQVIAAVAVNTDVTERRRNEATLRELNETLEQRVADRTAELEQTQEALRQSQKLEAMGQLTGGVAHDFNNLLSPIIASLDMLTLCKVGNERERRSIDGALQSAERAKTLVQRLLAFARRQPLQPVPVDLGDLIRNMAELIASTAGPAIDVQVELSKDLPPALVDPNQLELAVLNLSVNARDAMPDGGVLRISVDRDLEEPGGRPKPRQGDFVRLSVMDTGTGMDEATLRRAIEPFFSTKGVGKGTGLGLSMVHGLAAQLGGSLAISSRPGVGTTIDLWLPVSQEPAGARDPDACMAPEPNGLGTVLLVDDEVLVRMGTADMLMDFGYDVVEASSGEKALQLVEEGLVPDLLLTDHRMPGMTGFQLAQMLRARWPDLPVLVVSGYAERDGVAPGLPQLTKPFRQAELAARLKNVLERSSAQIATS